jgi:6-pyruvoyltetrahydropterin/6-carboxytetrahydropterin synthase
MVVDFTHIERLIKNKMSHKHLNEAFDFNPTAENIAKWVVDSVPLCFKAIVKENDNNEAIYELEN